MKIKVEVKVKAKENIDLEIVKSMLKKELNEICWNVDLDSFVFKPKAYDRLAFFGGQPDYVDLFEYTIYKVSNELDFLPICNESFAMSTIKIIGTETNMFEVHGIEHVCF